MPSVSRGLYKWLLQGGACLDDMADRLNHVWTVALLMLLGAIISWKQGYTEPIQCWTPAEFPDQFVAYTNQLCWQQNLIVKTDDPPFTLRFPLVTERGGMVDIERGKPSWDIKPEDITTTMYQWIPMILCLQALLFKLPNVLMYIFHGYSGLSFEKVRSLTSGFDALNMEDKRILGRQTARYVQIWLNNRLVSLPWRALTVVWFVVKVLYVMNVIAQLTLVDHFLSTKKIDNATSYGELIQDNFQYENVTYFRETPAFPRKIMCSFEIRHMQNVHRYLVTCTLHGNIFTEHAYMFLWVWLVFVAVVTVVSLVIWLLQRLLPIFRRRYIQQYLDMTTGNDSTSVTYHGIENFSDSYLGEDGVFVLKLIGCNSSHLLVSHVVNQLWAFSRHQNRASGVVVAPPPGSQTTPSGNIEQIPMAPVGEETDTSKHQLT